jgi:membrane protein insertase Oxa1/YidC/SpoIIIJ
MKPILEILKFIFFSLPLGILVYVFVISIMGLIQLYKTIKNLNHGHRK